MKKFLLVILCLCVYVQCNISTSAHQDIVAKKTKNNLDSKKEENTTEEKEKKEPINENDFQPVLLGALLDKPDGYIGKKIKFRGKFSSFTTLALDYEGALRKSKDYISLTIFRPETKIPLSELKLAYPVKEAKENQVIRELEESDLIEINGEVFSAALDEPWVDIVSIKKLESASKNLEDKIAQEKKEEGKNTKKEKKKVKKSKVK